ncbi:hypothetical protein C8R43DRAFT_1089921 [Mycena crocata]|nr:hypothetical protein C8R43DRAFT_1089921 [Mycena crocata]
MDFQTLVVNATTNVSLSYIDSGAPSTPSYTTIFAVHGMLFTNLIFEKIIDIAPSHGVRVVAINRRHFPGSTPFTPEELNVVFTGGSGDDERDAQMEARGHEIGTFIATFVQKFHLPPLSADGKEGGSVLLGWSVGAPYQLAAIASADTLSEDTRSVLSAHVRSLILYEPAPIALGLPTPAQNWNPLVDNSIPAPLQLAAFGQWVTAYFDHQSIETRDLDSLSWVLTAPDQSPTLYGIPADKLGPMLRLGEDATTDLPFLFFFANQLVKAYRKAFYDGATAALFPKMKKSFLCGDRTAAFGVCGLWAVQDDQAIHGPSTKVTFKFMNGTNHFGHWDDAETVLKTFISLA